MALRNVVRSGDPVLKKKCRPVTDFNERLAQLLDDMIETVLAEDGLGLAAPQVGVMRRVFVALDESSQPPQPGQGAKSPESAGPTQEAETEACGEGEYVPVVMEFVNPEIIEQEGEQLGYEGCLSFPGRFGAITRPQKVKIRAFDRYGNVFECEGADTFARCLCHENNHLDGVTIDDLAAYFYDPEVPHELDGTLAEERHQAEEEAR